MDRRGGVGYENGSRVPGLFSVWDSLLPDAVEIVLIGETTVRLLCFAGVFAAMAVWEAVAPLRQDIPGRVRRWPGNLGIVAVDSIVSRLIVPMSATGVAAMAQRQGFGLFNIWPMPDWIALVASVILLDLAIYAQHVGFHAMPSLWRLHRMHHADTGYDVTTGLRFHPGEILLSIAIKFAAISLLGAPAAAVLVFEVLLNATSMFNHGNVTLPAALDRWLRLVLVTPDMHRVHHSVVPSETDSNFGFNLPWWDRLFGTYRARPSRGHLGMTIGLDLFRDPREQRLDRMLSQPFRGRSRRGGLAR